MVLPTAPRSSSSEMTFETKVISSTLFIAATWEGGMW